MAKVKGTALVPAVKLVRKNRKKMEPLLDGATRAFVSRRILPGAWYPMEDASRLLLAVCRFVGGSPAQAMELVGSYCAEDDLRGVYAHMIQPGDPERTFRRAVTLCRNYVDTATLSVVHMDAGLKRYIMRLDGMPKSDVPYCACVLGMARVVARLLGMEDSYKINEARCALRGEPFCEFHCTWG